MSFERGWRALHLEMNDRIPHTEYCSHPKWKQRLTGLAPSDPGLEPAFIRAWDFDLLWMNLAPPDQPRLTHMGTAVWDEGFEVTDNRECPFRTEEDVLRFEPTKAIHVWDVDELAGIYQEQWRGLQDAYPTCVVPGGFYNTVFSWCILTFGWEMFLSAAATAPERFDRVLQGFHELSLVSFQAQAKTDMKVFICHDDIVWTAGAVFHPDWYRRYVFPRYKELWRPLKEAGIILLFCSDGDFTEFVDDLVDAGADGFIFEPVTNLEVIAARYGKTHVIVGNVDCRVLMTGDKERIYADVRRCADLGRDLPGYFFAVGNHIPYNIPIEGVQYYADAIEELGRR